MANPQVNTDIRAAVLERAQGQCECGGSCGRTHYTHRPGSRVQGRCHRVDLPGARLVVLPVTDVPLAEAARLGADQLGALCPQCAALVLRARRRARARRVAAQNPTEALF
ncbi:hypothetical protein TH66_00225 [Carbonactinospora thermoautotrophica]|uniref:HNH endonuclease n=1 Tax=Carbonactinospora thermoautotrophica TaxID=1469144 RepID=A0A132N7I1_9ACTN|nr:hypothetical protein [Carbonactinospora thermoautotrophica]KWX04624.1 hypothetical protein TR74_24170 [Carbonactinospora thermoautotrophica]KWX05976.1 hypothetical protein TH66_00225 [Carbonactinospora thermoautotrophica]